MNSINTASTYQKRVSQHHNNDKNEIKFLELGRKKSPNANGILNNNINGYSHSSNKVPIPKIL
jgi:hypothetical protein